MVKTRSVLIFLFYKISWYFFYNNLPTYVINIKAYIMVNLIKIKILYLYYIKGYKPFFKKVLKKKINQHI